MTQTTYGFAETLREQARDYERLARNARKLADRIDNPGTGVRVEINERLGVVRFIGPECLRAPLTPSGNTVL